MSSSWRTFKTLHRTFKPIQKPSINKTQFSTQTIFKQTPINKPFKKPKLQLPTIILTGSLTGILLLWINLKTSNPISNEEFQKVLQQDNESGLTNTPQSTKSNTTYPESNVFIWGSNRNGIPAPGSDTEIIKKPIPLPFFQEEALRDLVLHEKYAVAVDSRGDLYQWGSQTPSNQTLKPTNILSNHDIKQIACTSYKIYALSKSGKVYIIPSGTKETSTHDQTLNKQNRSWWPWWLGGSNDSKSQLVCLKIDSEENQLSWREKFTSISAGDHHLLAITSKGRTFASAVDLQANSHGQLGLKQVKLNKISQQSCLVPLNPLAISDTVSKPINPLTPQLPWLPDDPLRKNSKPEVPVSKVTPLESTIADLGIEPEHDINFCTTLHEIPALRQLNIVQIACGSSHSLVRTATGDVLAYGSNLYGQLAAGASLLFPALPAPTEVDMPRSKDYSRKCIGLAAAGDTSYLVTEKEDVKLHRKTIEVLAAGYGQFGGVGNGQWNHQASPVKVKTISGLMEWGHNVDYQLGNRKRANLSIPQHISPLPKIPKDESRSKAMTTEIESGTSSPMPHHRLQLNPKKKIARKDAEETVVAGWDTTAVYWRLIQ
ncbi:uncharacterized protein MELLADRAFT_103408 [Melampsora larici-populina 98AG31]|uniref:Uncharacterized protein n=1 Tax=Melampsora larici-populina (strain 98AG31 / pathotype 3-4-7) TaxID=747676 RepID=F4RBD5_MELLP|nr:uncharacterized protein MELLADRAFT_103408 [Melampsora larici-populina 98AG31]EGG10065.1 hypothetical protein MELLADRAFT_103408 [Melampsora larici-populina 98AG31]